MSRYALPELLKLWERAELTVEQVIGQILQHLLAQDKEIKELKCRLPKLPSTQ